MDINKVLVSNKISYYEYYKYFIGYWYGDYKIKPLHLMLLKTSAYVIIIMVKRNGCILIDDDELLRNTLIFGIK